jgi:hypothetical protein
MKTRQVVIGCSCLILVALLSWRLAADGFNANWLFGPPVSAKSVPALDSFSEPSVGLALLRQRAADLMFAYQEDRNQSRAPQSEPLQEGTATGTGARPSPISSSLIAFNRPAPPEVPALREFWQLRAELRDLDLDLDWKLMGVYCMNGWDDQFLDCYLRLVTQLPLEHKPGIEVWTPYALGCAEKRGRAQEVTDALHHAIRFHPTLPGTRAMKEGLDQWETEHRPVSEVSQR